MLVALALGCRERGVDTAGSGVKEKRTVDRAVETMYAIETDRSEYALVEGAYGPQVRIVASFTAPEDSAVFIVNCNGAITTGLQRRDGSEWRNAWIAETNGCMSAPIVVDPGATHTETMAVVSRDPGSGLIQRGTYRVAWHNMYTSFDPESLSAGVELPLAQRISAPIFIEVATDVERQANRQREENL